MKTRKDNYLQRMMAVLLSAVLVTGMVSNAAPMTVLAQESVSRDAEETQEGVGGHGAKESGTWDSVSGNEAVTAEGDTTPEEGTDSEGQKAPQANGANGQEYDTGEATEPGTVIGNDAADEKNGILQALLARIAALPDAEEYLTVEPDVDSGEADEDAYEQWLAGLYAYAEEALAIQEAVEELSEEEQAAIPGETLARLAVWVEMAQTARESAQVMMADTMSGNCGDNVTWKLADGILTISGSGAMKGPNANNYGWYPYSESIQKVVIESGVTYIDSNPFYKCSALTEIVIPETVERIGAAFCAKCTSLSNLQIPKSVKEIDDFAFSSSSLTRITIPGSVKKISDYMFNNCSSLESVTLENGVETIENNVFNDCTKLTAITIPGSVTSIGISFDGGGSLQNVYFEGTDTIPALQANSFGKSPCVVNNTKGLHIPSCQYLNAYLNTEGWDAYRNNIDAPHTLSYSASGAVITQTCSDCGLSATATLSTDKAEYTHTGNAIEPAKITYSENWVGEKPENTDIVYENNTDPGTATAKLTVSGATAELTFTIQPKALTDGMVSLSADSFPHTGNPVTPGVTVKDGGVTLTEGTNYTLSYTDNTDVGTAAVTVTGKGNYSGTVTKNFEIVESDADKAAAAKEVVEDALAGITATNTTTKEEILGVINAALVNNGITGVTVEIEKFVRREASTSAAGSIEGYVRVICGEAIEGLNMNRPIAQLTTGITDFARFKEAVSKGGTVTITQDITLTETVTVDKDVTIVSDGSHTIHRGEKCNDSMFTVSGGTLTLGDGSGTLILDGGAVWSGEADATLNRGKNNTGINANASIIRGNGGNIVLKENTVLRNNCCISEGYGGAVTLHGSSLRIEGAMICGNKSRDGGGAVKTYKDSSVVMTGGEICHNEAGTHGGAFQIYGSESGNQASHSEVSCKISGGSIHNNLAGGVGGGIAVSNHSAVELSGSVIISNNKTTDSGRRGGGVGFIDKDTSLTVAEQVQIKDNLYGDKINNVAVGTNENNLITISGSNPLSGSASIGITTINKPTKEKLVNITGANGADYSRYFTSDDQQYAVADSADHAVKLTLPKSDSDKLVEVIKIVTAALDDYTATNDTTRQSIQEVIDAALNDAGIADAKVEVRDFQKTEATTEAEGSIQAEIYVECGTQNKTENVTVKIDKVKPHTHALTLTPAKDPTCTEDGNTAYYVCGGEDGCGKWFSDAAGTQEITDHGSVVIPETGHEYDETAWGYKGADGHAHKCRNCDAHDAVQPHILGGAATAETPQTCTVCGYVIKPATGNEPGTGTQPGAGTITPEVKLGENAPATEIFTSNPNEKLEDMLLTDAEKQQVQNGTAVRIVLEVKDAGSAVSDADKESVRQKLNGFTVGQYLNIDLYKLIGENRTNVTETEKKIRIVITVPDSLRSTDSSKTRTFAVIRVHNGQAERLEDLDSSADTITIETDRFSTYTVAYQDKANGGEDNNTGDSNGGSNGNNGNNSGGDNGGNNGNGSSQNKDGAKPNSSKDREPKTGDDTPIELYATLAMIAGFAYLLLYFTDPERGMTEARKQELVSRLVAWAKRGGRIRRCLALAAIFVLLVYYHSTKKLHRGSDNVEWKEIYGK